MSYTKWNPVQACVWIATHDESAVASLRSNHTFAELAFDERLAPLFGPGGLQSAKLELMRACEAGALPMYGRPFAGGVSIQIPPPAFHGMEFYDELPDIAGEFEDELSHTLIERLSSLEEGGGGVWMGLPDVARSAADCWSELRLQADQVRSVWPPSEAAPDAITTATPNCKVTSKPRKPTFEEVSAWYAQRVMDHDPKRLPPSRPDDEKAARQYFAAQGLDGRGIRDLVRLARDRHAPASWKETGAKTHEAYDDDRKARAAVG